MSRKQDERTDLRRRYFYHSLKGRSFWSKLAVISFVSLVRVLYRPVYHGLEYLPEGGFFLAGNHLSLLDPVVLQPIVPQWVYWVAKAELFRAFFVGFFVKQLEAIPLEREKADVAAVRAIVQHIRQDHVVGIFPQGTRVAPENEAEHEPKSGVASIALKFSTTIVPFYIQGPYRLFRRNHIYFGAPYCLYAGSGKKPDHETGRMYSREVMNRSFALKNGGDGR